MRKKLSTELMKDLKSQGYSALIAPGQLGDDEVIYSTSKEAVDVLTDCSSCRPFEEDDIIILSDDVINYIPEEFFEGKEVEI